MGFVSREASVTVSDALTACGLDRVAAPPGADRVLGAGDRSLRILFLVSAHNGLSQRAWIALTERGHDVTVAVVDSAAAMEAAAREHDPQLIVCPFLKQIIPESIWQARRCLIVHPGPPGDRGPSSLDWAIELGERDWGVTVLQANGEPDAGRVWATREFAIRPVGKSSLYRHEVRHGAIEALVEAIDRILDAVEPVGDSEIPMRPSSADRCERIQPGSRAAYALAMRRATSVRSATREKSTWTALQPTSRSWSAWANTSVVFPYRRGPTSRTLTRSPARRASSPSSSARSMSISRGTGLSNGNGVPWRHGGAMNRNRLVLQTRTSVVCRSSRPGPLRGRRARWCSASR